MFTFKKEVRDSIAVELKKLSYYGSGAFALLGYATDSGVGIALTGVFYLTCQVAAHLLIALDLDDDEKDHQNQ